MAASNIVTIPQTISTLSEINDVDITSVSDGDLINWNSVSSEWENVSQNDVNKYQLLGSAEVSGSATDTLELTGLSTTDAKAVIVFASLEKSGSGTSNIQFFINSDTTTSNYNYQSLRASSTSVVAKGGTNAFCAEWTGSSKMVIKGEIGIDPSGIARMNFKTGRDAASTSVCLWQVDKLTGTVSSITSIEFRTPSGNELAVGSKISVYKVI